MEVEDNLKRKLHPQISLTNSAQTIGQRETELLAESYCQGTPFAYLLRESEFYGHRFYVDENVLIPRQETELLVDLLVQGNDRYKRCLDVGTGSGILALSLLREGVATSAVAVDLSPSALEVAQLNARRFRLEDRCEFLLSDRLQMVTGTFDLIVSNPPYIKARAHRDLVHAQVDTFEPAMALYLPDEDYDAWFEELFRQVKGALQPNGLFVMEGHEHTLPELCDRLRSHFSQVELRQDFAGLNRFLVAK